MVSTGELLGVYLRVERGSGEMKVKKPSNRAKVPATSKDAKQPSKFDGTPTECRTVQRGGQFNVTFIIHE